MRFIQTPLVVLLPLALLACGPSTPSAKPPLKTAAPPKTLVAQTPPKALSPLVSLKAQASLPEAFALDGDVSEWGSLVPPPPPAPQAKGKSAPEPPPFAGARDAPSHVAMVLSSAGLTLAAELTEASRDGIWLGFGFGAPELPPIGHFQRGGGMMELNCDSDMAGEPLPEEVQKGCRDTLERHADFVSAYKARFTRFLRLDRGGLSALDADGKLSPVEGAKTAVKTAGETIMLEATLPNSALPRASSAPIESIRLFARAADTQKPPTPKDEEWGWLDLPQAVEYEPFAKLRALAFQAPSMTVPLTMSYQPGDPLGLEVIDYVKGSDGTALEPRKELLCSALSTLGDIEISKAFLRQSALVILRKGDMVDMIETPGEPAGFVVRNKELHVFFYEHYTETDTWAEVARWQVFGIRPTGEYAEILVPAENSRLFSQGVEEFHTPAFDSFGIRGTPMFAGGDGEAPHPLEITWRYDPEEGIYQSKTRALPVRKGTRAR